MATTNLARQVDVRWMTCETRLLQSVDGVAQEFMCVFLPPFTHVFGDSYTGTEVSSGEVQQERETDLEADLLSPMEGRMNAQ